jgi:predicted MPP superfamily phosphohydrolase
VELEVAIPGLPAAFDGLSIAHVADVHFDPRNGWLDYYRSVAEVVNEWQADVVAFTGDFVNHRRFIGHSARYHGLIKGRLATLAVLGNHDYWTDAAALREACARAGIRLMHNNRWEIERHGRRLVFAGTDAPWGKTRSDLPNLLARGRTDAAILLSHTPDNAPRAAAAGASLVLSGHNHGGQYCLPVLGPVIVPSRTGHRYPDGVQDVGEGCVLVVSRGVGCSFERRGGRTLARPQVLRLVLRAELVEEQISALAASRAVAARPALPG